MQAHFGTQAEVVQAEEAPAAMRDRGGGSAQLILQMRGKEFKIGDRWQRRIWLVHATPAQPCMHALMCVFGDAPRVVVACTGKRQAQQLTGMDGDVIGLDGNGWVIVRTSDGSETLRIQQRYLSRCPKTQDEV